MSIKLYGSGLSPYVRRVRLALAHKQLEYELINVIPVGDDQPQEFKDNSPLGKIPLAQIDGHWLPDSSVIIDYLERTRPENPLLSDDPLEVARARWFESYASAPMTAVIGGHLFAELILAPNLFNRDSNLEEIELARTTEIPEIFDYLESQLEGDYLVGNSIGHADICVGSPLVTMHMCDYHCDANRWPKTAAYIDRLFAGPVFKPLLDEGMAMIAQITGG